MINILYESNLNEKIQALWKSKNAIRESRRSALSSAAFHISREVRKLIENEGYGSWPEVHPLTKLLTKEKGRWDKKRRYAGAYSKLAQLSRYKINPYSTEAIIGFGTKNDLDPKLMRFATEIQKDRFFPISRKQRRLFGATIGVLDGNPRDDKPGKDFFPFKKGKSIKIEARPIFKPVFQKNYAIARTIFTEKFEKRLREEYEKL